MPFNLAFQDDAQIRAWRTVKRFPKNASFVFDVVMRLHQLSLGTSPEWADKVDKCSLSNLYFEVMHSAMLVQLEEPWQEQLQSGTQGQEADIMYKIWAAGLPLFASATLRQLRTRQGINMMRHYHGPIFGRIQAILDGQGGYHAWPRGRNLEPILATLFYAAEACTWGRPLAHVVFRYYAKGRRGIEAQERQRFQEGSGIFPNDGKLSGNDGRCLDTNNASDCARHIVKYVTSVSATLIVCSIVNNFPHGKFGFVEGIQSLPKS